MKEDSKEKKTTTKKKTPTKTSAAKKSTTAKKTSAAQKSTTAKKTSAAKKSTTAKKTSAAKKVTTAKTASVKKKPSAKKVTNTKTGVNNNSQVKPKVVVENVKASDAIKIKDEVKVINEKNNNKDFLLRIVLIISYALIITILLIGFIESYTKDMRITGDYKPSYLVNEEILSKSNILKLENAKNTLSKLDGDYFVYVGYTKMYNNEVQMLDMGIANLIDKYDLKDKFYYLNIDPILNKKNKVDLVNNYLGYHDVLISKVPTILYVNNDNIITVDNIITREDDKLITVGDFQKLLDINQFVVKK